MRSLTTFAIHRGLFAVVAFGLLFINGAEAHGIVNGTLAALDDTLGLRNGAERLDFERQDLLTNDSFPVGTVLTFLTSPRHGVLEEVGAEDLIYWPGKRFRDFGTDQIVYQLEAPDGSTSTATLYLYANSVYNLVYVEGFETGSNPPILLLGEADGEISSSGMIAGSQGFLARVEDGGAAWIDDEEDPGDPPPGNNDSGRASGLIDDSKDPFDIDYLTLMEVGAALEFPSAIRLIKHSGKRLEAQAWDTSLGAWQGTPLINWVSSNPEVMVTWYRTGNDLGVFFEVDGRISDPVVVTHTGDVFDEFHFGAQAPPGAPLTLFGLDELKLWREAEGVAEHPFVRRMNFETSPLGSQDVLVGQTIQISSAGAITGDQGLALDLTANGQLRSTFTQPLDEMGLRVSVDATGVSTGSGEMFAFLATGINPSNFSERTMRLYLRNPSNQLQIAGHAYDEGGGFQTISWFDVPDQFELEFRIQRSSADLQANGLVQVWADDDLLEVFHIPNEDLGVHWLHLGGDGVDAGTQGTLRFDDLMVWDN